MTVDYAARVRTPARLGELSTSGKGVNTMAAKRPIRGEVTVTHNDTSRAAPLRVERFSDVEVSSPDLSWLRNAEVRLSRYDKGREVVELLVRVVDEAAPCGFRMHKFEVWNDGSVYTSVQADGANGGR